MAQDRGVVYGPVGDKGRDPGRHLDGFGRDKGGIEALFDAAQGFAAILILRLNIPHSQFAVSPQGDLFGVSRQTVYRTAKDKMRIADGFKFFLTTGL